jgi:hypothetical protein
MIKPTQSDIDNAIEELRASMVESIEASQAEEDSKLRKMKAHKRLSLARDSIRAISFN